MKLFDFILLIKRRRKLVWSVMAISFALMIIFTVFLNNVSYQISAAVKLESNVLLTSGMLPDTSDKVYSRVDLKLNQLDDKSAIEYVQNNKGFYDNSSMIDYKQVVSNLNTKEFMYSQVNSYSFKSYLLDKKIISSFKQINIVEQAESITIKTISDNASTTKELYEKIIKAVPMYIQEVIKNKIKTANDSINTSIESDKKQAELLVKQYADLKTTTKFADIESLNKGIEILNSLSGLSHNINENSSVSNKFTRLLSNEIQPYLILKNADFSGLKLVKTLISYIIIEIIASVLIGFLVAFIAECHNKVKMLGK